MPTKPPLCDAQTAISRNDHEDLRMMALQFMAVRQAIGVLGLAVLFILLAGSLILEYGLLPSLSDYYYTQLGDVFVGCLVATGVFLVTYLGYPPEGSAGFWTRGADWWLSTIAGVALIITALLPVRPIPCEPGICRDSGLTGHWDGWHYAAAGVFFLCMALFCLWLFPKQQPSARRAYFRRCGWIILACIAGLAITGWLTRGDAQIWLDRLYVFLWLEVIATSAFALAWLEKGRSALSPYALMGGDR